MKEYLGMHDAVFNTEYTILIKKKKYNTGMSLPSASVLANRLQYHFH